MIDDNAKSPFLDIQEGEFAYMLRTCLEEWTVDMLSPSKTPYRKQQIRVIKIPYNSDEHDVIPVKSITDAEDRLLKKCHSVEEKWEEIAFAIRRQAALIACRNRRGYANIALMNPSMIEKIAIENWTDGQKHICKPIGRWLEMGVICKKYPIGSTVYVNNCIPDDECYLLYKGSNAVDCAATILNHNKLLNLVMPCATNNKIIDISVKISQYITRIKFK